MDWNLWRGRVEELGIKIGDITARFELMNQHEPTDDRVSRRFVDHDEALRFLRRQLLSDAVMAAARGWAGDLGVQHRTHKGFLQLLASAIISGEIWVAELTPASARQGGGSGKKVDPIPPRPRPDPKPKPKPKPVAELLVILRNLFGKPVEGVMVTAGALGSMKTDKDGNANFGTVAPGTYDISAEKPGHGKKRNGIEEKDEKKGVSVPDGSKTVVNLVQHPECANVAFFEGSKTRANYFGFDHKTNFKAGPKPEYWTPVPAKGSLTMPPDKLTFDAARWVSVAVGKEAELEINYGFLGSDCIPCLANSTFEVVPASVAEVVTAKIGAKQAVFKIKGKAEGEASLKVVCDGHDVGWFRIWCKVEKTLLVDVATILTKRTKSVTFDLAGLETYMNDILRQALIKLKLTDLGEVDLSADTALEKIEDTEYPVAGGTFQKGTAGATDTAFLTAADNAALKALKARTTGAKPQTGARRLYWYVSKTGAEWGGENISIGHKATFIYYEDGTEARNTGAHEISHSLGLHHPNDSAGSAEFAAHNSSTCNHAVEEIAATNTEPKVLAHAKHSNVMASDPTNLMGYWHDKTARKHLRYHQWKAIARS